MAEEAPSTENAEAPKKKSPMLMFIIVGVLMAVEAVAVFAVVSMTGGGAAKVDAAQIEGEISDEDIISEVELLKDQFQNVSTGTVWEWKVEIYVQVREKNLEGARGVTSVLEKRAAEIQEGVSIIFRSAQHKHLQEDGYATLKRQLKAYADEVFGVDAEGLPRIEGVLLPTCKGFQI